jgi:hypothetical protein
MTDLTKYFPDGLEINPKQFEAEDLFRKGYKIKAVSIEIGLSEFEVASYKREYLEIKTREKALDYYAMGCSIKVVANLVQISLDEAQKYAELFLHEMRKHESQKE